MSTILFYTSPASGHLFPAVPMMRELDERGHDVHIRTFSEHLGELRGLGLGAEAIDPAIEARPIDDWKANSDKGQIELAMKTFADRAPHEIEDLQKAITELSPDALVIDINTLGASAAAEASGIPWAHFSPYFTWLPAKGVPPFGPGLERRTDLLGRVRDGLLTPLVEKMLNATILDRLNDLRSGIGAPAQDSLLDTWTRADRLIYLTVPEFEYPRDRWPESFHFVGPLNWDRGGSIPAEIESDHRPLILLSASTEYQSDDALLRVGLEAMAAHPDLLVVATAGANELDALPSTANSHVAEFVDHGPLLPRTDVVICHGGMGITQKALGAGVPVCVVPFGRDQREVGRRVEAAGAGVMLPAKKLSRESLDRAVAQARSKRAGAQRIAAAMDAAPGASGAADVIESLVTRDSNRSIQPQPIRQAD